MKVSIGWLKELVKLNVSIEELITLIPMRTIGLKETNEDSIELDMKGYNRADLLSMRGVAREVAAITGFKVKFAEEQLPKYDLPPARIQVENASLCPVYCIAKIEGLKSGPSSPKWMEKLADCGMRSVNNIADVTNLVMLEFGQPMHSFDADKVADETLVVRLAHDGETITTLDGKNRKLDKSDLLIADAKHPLGIAGVMGGKDSEASDSTTTILLEAAIFDPISIRKSTQRHNLFSEASRRFQHGLTRSNLLQALSAAIKIYESLGGKLTAITLTGDLEDKPKTVNFRLVKVNSLVGIEFATSDVKHALQSLGFTLASNTGGWQVTVPDWRLDISIEEDLVEEVARMYGYEKIPAKELTGKLPEKIDQSLFDLIYDLKKTAAEAGLTEVQTYSFYSTQVLENFNVDKNQLVKVANPISAETEYLRFLINPNLVEVAAKNLKQGFKEVAVFEIGKVYKSKEKGLPEEKYKLAVLIAGDADNLPAQIYQIIKNISYFKELKAERVDIKELWSHPKRFWDLNLDGKNIGFLKELHPRITHQFGIAKRVAILELDLN